MIKEECCWYEIRLQGHLAERWSGWFEGLDLRLEPGGVTILDGRLPDQAALHADLMKIRDLGLRLISISREVG